MHLSPLNGQMQCFHNFVLLVITHISASAANVFLHLTSVVLLTTGICSASIISAHSLTSPQCDVFTILCLEIELCPDLYYIGLGVGRMTIKPIIEFREMQKDAFSAPHRGGLHLMRNSKILHQDGIYTLQV